MLNEASRRALVESLTLQAMDGDRARLAVDIACKAAQDGMDAMMRGCRDLAPDQWVQLCALQIATQILNAQTAQLAEAMHCFAESEGIAGSKFGVAVELDTATIKL